MSKLRIKPSFENENALWDAGFKNICGIDEVGRGCWAGPLIAAAVIFDQSVDNNDKDIAKINDSKKLTLKMRERLADFIISQAKHWGIGMVSSKELDKIGLAQANLLAMERAVLNLGNSPDYCLVDGNIVKNSLIIEPFKNIIKGDCMSVSIAAASILAKVFRDKIMVSFDELHPEYGFKQHKGYGTRKHRKIIEKSGILPVHRKSFAPIKELLTI